MTKRDDEVVVVCVRITTPLMIPDNRIGKCSACGWRVQFRPHAPRGRRLCMECADDVIGSGAKVVTTPRMLEDYRDYLRKRKH